MARAVTALRTLKSPGRPRVNSSVRSLSRARTAVRPSSRRSQASAWQSAASVRLTVVSASSPACASRSGQQAAAGVVDVHHRVPGVLGGEQRGLGGEVGLLVAVEVEVVPAEVGEGRDGKGNGVDAAQCEGVGGDLHRHGLRALLAEVAEQALQVGGLRRGDGGSGGLEWPAVQGEADRPDHPGPDPGGPQRRVEQVAWWWSCRWFRSPRTWSWPRPASRRSPPPPGPSPGAGRRPRRAARPAVGPARHRRRR